MEMNDRAVLVTGAAQGIGLGIARAFAEAGARVAMCDRNAEALGTAAQDVSKAVGADRVIALAGDVSVTEDVERMAEKTVKGFGTIDVLVNNAGFGSIRRFWELDPQEWKGVLDTNLTGTFLFSSAVARRMLTKGTRGRIINIASTNALIPSTGLAAYCASKGGVLMFTRVAALELAPHGITVNAIGPGSTLTPLTQGFYNLPGLREAFLDRTPMGRLGTPEDIAGVALLLASKQASWVTGQILLADGGQALLGLPRYVEGLEEAARTSSNRP